MTTSQTQSSELTELSHSNAEQYLTFMLDREEYGVEILRVQGIQGWDSVTPIPNTPDYVLGVINLRGLVVPIIDLRKRFQLEDIPFGPTTVVIVVKVIGDGSERIVGMVADAVSEVYNINQQEVKPAPDFGSAVDTEFVRGLASLDEKMVILLDVDHLVNAGIMNELTEAEVSH
jgi:purine-binding chemotaxis protein CheW